jgi:hypothetical protein
LADKIKLVVDNSNEVVEIEPVLPADEPVTTEAVEEAPRARLAMQVEQARLAIEGDRLREDPFSIRLMESRRSGKPLVLVCYRETMEGRIRWIGRTEVSVGEKRVRLEKAEILYAFDLEEKASVAKTWQLDPEIEEQQLAYEKKQSERHQVEGSWLTVRLHDRRPITVTMRNGHRFTGRVVGHGYFSFDLEVAPEVVLSIQKTNVFGI